MTTKPTRGGARRGAGRKPRAGKACAKWIKIRATEDEIATFKALGGSEWFRDALKGGKPLRELPRNGR